MALTLSSETTLVTSLEDYKEYVSQHVDVSDPDSVCASADQLKALANNKTFLTEHLNNELSNWREWQRSNPYTAQTLLLGGNSDFLVRANIWLPPPKDPVAREEQRRLFFYEVPHDHNFSFLTVGYFGSGYETTIYEYDPSTVQGEIGEKVKLRFLENTTLPQGKMMFYRKCQDIHTQGYPKEFSISLNLLLSSPEAIQRDQYFFDLESSRIKQYARNAFSSHMMICRVARYIGNSETVNLLDALSRSHTSQRVRIAATESLSALEPSSNEAIWEYAADDSGTLVREHARRQLSRGAA
jgi:hypothetical protein